MFLPKYRQNFWFREFEHVSRIRDSFKHNTVKFQGLYLSLRRTNPIYAQKHTRALTNTCILPSQKSTLVLPSH